MSNMKPTAFHAFLTAIFVCLPLSHAAIVANYTFTSDLTSSDSDATSTASVLQTGGGFDAVDVGWGRSGSLSDLYVRSNFTSAALTTGDYISFSVTSDPGTLYQYTSITFKYSVQIANSGGTGNFSANAVVRSSLDNFSTDLATFAASRVGIGGTNVTNPQPLLDLSAFAPVSGPVEFRIYIYDNVDNTNNQQRFDNIVVNADAIPEPAVVAMVGLGFLAFGSRRRR